MKSSRLATPVVCIVNACFATAALAEPAQPSNAEADQVDASQEAPPSEPLFRLHFSASPGLSTMGAHVGAMGLVRFGALAIGPTVSFSGLLSSRVGGSLAVGAGTRHLEGLGFDVLGELGANSHHAGGALLSSDPGASGTVPYAGGRAGVHWSFGSAKNRVRPLLGLWLFVRQDLTSRQVSYQYQSSELLSHQSTTVTGTAQLGGQTEVGLALRGGFDVTP